MGEELSDENKSDSRPFVPLPGYIELPREEMLRTAASFRDVMQRRRTVREFDNRPVPDEVIENCLRAAVTAPSGANMQPWHFTVVRDKAVRKRIREEAEIEERHFYSHRASEEWLEALAPLGTDSNKPFLEVAPCLIAIFVQRHGELESGRKVKHYYPGESVGLATGILLSALQHAGLATLTHTPSPMKFLNKLLNRPVNERPFLLLVVGYPADDATVPDIQRKPFSSVVDFV